MHKRAEAAGPIWHVAMRPGNHRLLNSFIEPEFVAERVEKAAAAAAPRSKSLPALIDRTI